MNSKANTQLSGVLFIFVTLLSWSTVLLFLRYLAPRVDGWTSNGWRYGLSALVLSPAILTAARQRTLPSRIWLRALPPTFFNSVGQAFFAFSIYFIEPGLAGFLIRVSLVSSTIGALVMFADERRMMRSPQFWTGLALIAAGSIGTLALGSKPLQGGVATGVIIAILAGLFFGLYGVNVRYFMKGVPSTLSFAVICAYTGIVMVGLMLLFGRNHGFDVPSLSAKDLSLVVVSALLGIVVGHLMYYRAIERLGVAVASAIVQLSPFFCAFGSMLIFDEWLTAGQWLSGAIMLGGSVLLLRSEHLRRTGADVQQVPETFPVEPEIAGSPAETIAQPMTATSGAMN